MSRRLRLTLAVIGLIIAILAASALLYALWPVDTLRDQGHLVPSLFIPPAP